MLTSVFILSPQLQKITDMLINRGFLKEKVIKITSYVHISSVGNASAFGAGGRGFKIPAAPYQRCKLEDLKVLRRSPDLLNNVKIGQGQQQLIMEQILFLPFTFLSSDLNNLMNNPSNSPVISDKKMFR